MNETLVDLAKAANSMVVPYSESYAVRHREFAYKFWPNKTRRHSENYIRWKFRGPVEGAVDGFLLAVMNEQVVGQLGVLPVSLLINNNLYPAQWACDLMVDSSLRRHGIGSMLFAMAMQREMITLGSDPSAAADATMASVGFKPLQGAFKMIFPLDLTYLIDWKWPNKSSNIPYVLQKIGQKLVVSRQNRLLSKKKNGVMRGYWEDVKSLVKIKQSSLEVPHVFHDDDFLTWRCNGLPEFSPKLPALWINSGAYAIYQVTNDVLIVYDWASLDGNSTQALFCVLLKLAQNSHCKMINAYANSAEEHNWLRETGFLTQRRPVKVIYYDPLNTKINQYHQFYYSIFDSDGNL